MTLQNPLSESNKKNTIETAEPVTGSIDEGFKPLNRARYYFDDLYNFVENFQQYLDTGHWQKFQTFISSGQLKLFAFITYKHKNTTEDYKIVRRVKPIELEHLQLGKLKNIIFAHNAFEPYRKLNQFQLPQPCHPKYDLLARLLFQDMNFQKQHSWEVIPDMNAQKIEFGDLFLDKNSFEFINEEVVKFASDTAYKGKKMDIQTINTMKGLVNFKERVLPLLGFSFLKLQELSQSCSQRQFKNCPKNKVITSSGFAKAVYHTLEGHDLLPSSGSSDSSFIDTLEEAIECIKDLELHSS